MTEPKEKQPAKTVGELIAILSNFPPELLIEGAWEGISSAVFDVYRNGDTVYLNVDGDY